MDLKNEKIRKSKRRFDRLNKKYLDIIDKLGYLRSLLKDYERLEHREECPLCNHKISSEYYKKKIPQIKSKIFFLEIWIDQNYNRNKIIKILKPITESKEKQRKERDKQILTYLNENRNRINKAIRTFELPNNIKTNDEMSLWNDAIQIQLDKKGIIENEDLEFILN